MTLSRLNLPEGFPTEILVVDSMGEAPLPVTPWTLLADEAIRPLWRKAGLPEPPGTLWVRLDESTKRLETLIPWLEDWASIPLHRNATLVAVGGGIVTDMGGLAASLFLRGIAWHCWPTTLLAQADAGLGGKTAVNLATGKNLVGAFHPPQRLVVCDVFLDTLPPRQIEAGFWEVFKMALMEGDTAWAEALLDMRRPDRASMSRALAMKADVVHRDPREAGERRLLNLGHTLGHAMEIAGGHGLLHGEAVGLGVLSSCLLAQSQGLPAFPERLLQGMAKRLRNLKDLIPPWEACLPVLARDKKAYRLHGATAIHCILPTPGARAHQKALAPECWACAHQKLLVALS